MDVPLPPSLLSRLSEDMASAHRDLATASVPDSSRSMRDYASRRLLAMTPRALTTLEGLLDADPKVALGAATKILDKSPATRDDPLTHAVADSLPPAAIEALSLALSAFATAALSAAATPAPSPVTVEVLNAD